jgi:hypothetical protein
MTDNPHMELNAKDTAIVDYYVKTNKLPAVVGKNQQQSKEAYYKLLAILTGKL